MTGRPGGDAFPYARPARDSSRGGFFLLFLFRYSYIIAYISIREVTG